MESHCLEAVPVYMSPKSKNVPPKFFFGDIRSTKYFRCVLFGAKVSLGCTECNLKSL